MSILQKLKPKFWDYKDATAGSSKFLYNYRRMWKLAVLLTAGVVLTPLIFMAVIDYKVTQHDIESEILLRTSMLVSNTRRTVSFFLAERRSALHFIDEGNTCEELNNPGHLSAILKNLKKGFGGFVDLGVIDSKGKQKTYVGPFHLAGKDYSDQTWFKEVVGRGLYISDVFLGYRKVPHLVIAVKHSLPEGLCYVLRATLDTEKFNNLITGLEMAGQGDAFIINHEGRLQTPSRSHGRVFQKISLPVPKYAPKTRVLEWKDADGIPLIIGYRYIEDTPFILMVVRQKEALMKPWYRSRTKFIGFLLVSISVILLVILSGATYLVTKIHHADEERIMTLHNVEYSSKMASLGRLAAGVAHEINNPLAIIYEQAGLIKDLYTIKKEYANDKRLMRFVESVLSSVERCAAITKRLLNFARHMDASLRDYICLKEIIEEVLGFLGKEAEYRCIAVSMDVPDDLPQFESNRGRVQEIFLNIFNNAFDAMDDGGRLDINARQEDEGFIWVTITDNGCGIPEKDLRRIFEPFFSSRKEDGGTGLGLSITYGLLEEIGGSISVKSEVGGGTTFTVRFPLKIEEEEKKDSCEYY